LYSNIGHAAAGDATSYLPATPSSVLLKAGQWEAAAAQLPETLRGFTTDIQNLRGTVMKLAAHAATPLQQALQLLTQSWPQSLWDSATLVEAPADVRQLQAHCTALEQQLLEVTEEANRLQVPWEWCCVVHGVRESHAAPSHDQVAIVPWLA
jgi:hypothetical protein